MSYIVSQNSVITLIGGGTLPSGNKFLTCGGTNIAPKTSTTWANFSVNTTNFKYIFNVGNFNGKTAPLISGYPEGGLVPTTIKQSLFNRGDIQYICGQFSLTGGANNIARFNPSVSKTATTTFNTLSGITFTGSNNAVNCISSDTTGAFTKIYLAGRFDTANISGATTYKNMVRLNVTTTPTYTIDTGFTTATTLIDSSDVTINSMIVVNRILYVAGTNTSSGNCIFYSYNGTAWTNLLLGVSPITGNINVLQEVSTTRIAIGGKFTSIGNATNCNNIAYFTISTTSSNNSFTNLGSGVSGVPVATPIYPSAEVFALSYLGTNLWVGGYFVNAGGSTANSIATYNGSSWNPVKRDNATTGLLKDTGGTDPGVVYGLSPATIDTSIIMAGGSFRTTTNAATGTTIYNLVKITNTTTPSTTSTTRTYSKFNSTSVSTIKN